MGDARVPFAHRGGAGTWGTPGRPISLTGS